MDASHLIRTARRAARLSARALARRAGTSHATLLAYESGAKIPRVDTLVRLVRAAGFALDAELSPRADSGDAREAKGHELAEALELASQFPVRHEGNAPAARFEAAP